MFPTAILTIIGDYTGTEQEKYDYKLILRYKQRDDQLQIKVERRSKTGQVIRKIMLPGKEVYMEPILEPWWRDVMQTCDMLRRAISSMVKFSKTYPMKDRHFYHEIRVRMDAIAYSEPSIRDWLAAGRDDQIEMLNLVRQRYAFRFECRSYLLTDTNYSHRFQDEMQDDVYFQKIWEKLKWALYFLQQQKKNYIDDYKFNPFSRW